MKIKDHSTAPSSDVLDTTLFDQVCHHIYDQYEGSTFSISVMLSISADEASDIAYRAIRYKLLAMFNED